MWLKRRRLVLPTIFFILIWFAIILLTPSQLNDNKPRRQEEHGANNPELSKPKAAPRARPTIPRIRIVDIDEDASDDQGEREREAQLRDENHAIDIKEGPPHLIRIVDEVDQEQKDLWDLEGDLIPRDLPGGLRTLSAIWNLTASWVKPDAITPRHNPHLGAVLHAMATRRIAEADVGFKGTQLKARLVLSGGQWVVFKPGRYKRDEIIEGTPYAGYDRHTGEIAAFHLDRVLGFHRAPIVVGRRVNLRTEIKPVASQSLLQTFSTQDKQTCFYGKCYYCKPSDPACSDEDGMMEGSLTMWLPRHKKLKKWRHLWARTYRENKKAKWELDTNYCQEILQTYPIEEHRQVVDMFDTAAFDYLIGNADRHQYETFEEDGDQGMLLLMDSAKSFGNPHHDERSVLAPLEQCCKIRKSTWTKLLSLQDGRLSLVMARVLSHDPLAPVLTALHLQAMDRRLITVIQVIHKCLQKHGQEFVLIQ
ncbi:glycosaminoglycan xylosylkinase-like [Asterias rubens]|uniref:glycosaminoglycan xylosylkinase-like n=1 Tax=Asterias rubens TaxID=7604 RepID=UPI0014550870|nr:glycosaminoglycan xylosylkinase-like [Asterias rubens]